MPDYLQHLTIRGNPIEVQGNRAHITIRTALPQKNTTPTVGLSDKLLDYIDKYHKILFVTVLYPKASFSTTARSWMKGAKKEPRLSYYKDKNGNDTYWYLYRKPIPREAFEINKPTAEELEKKHLMQSLGYYG